MCATFAVGSVLAPGDGAAPQTLQLASYLGLSAVVIAVVLCGGLLLHRVVRGGWRLKAAKRSLRVVDLLPLGGKRQLAVVQVYDRTLVLGLGEGGVRLLCEWDADSGPLPTAPAPREEAERPAMAPAAAPRSQRARAVLAALHGTRTERGDAFEAALEAALAPRDGTIVPVPRAAPARAKATAKPATDRRVARASTSMSSNANADKRERAERPERAVAPARERTREQARAQTSAPARHPTIEELLGPEGVLG